MCVATNTYPMVYCAQVLYFILESLWCGPCVKTKHFLSISQLMWKMHTGLIMDDNYNQTIQAQGSQYLMHICITHKWNDQVSWEFSVDNEKCGFGLSFLFHLKYDLQKRLKPWSTQFTCFCELPHPTILAIYFTTWL